MRHWALLWWLLFTNISTLFSIRFDDYGDPNEDRYYPCFHVGSKCYITEDCCWPATCVLTAWSPTLVCLVPGYKQNMSMMSFNTPAKQEDIIYLQNILNSSFFNALFFSNISQHSSEQTLNSTKVETQGQFNIDEENNTLHYVENNGSKDSTQNTEFSDKVNNSSLIHYPESLIKLLTDEHLQHYQSGNNNEDQEFVVDDNFATRSPNYLNNSSNLEEFSTILQNKGRFVLLSSTIKSKVERNNISDVFGKFKNGDQFKDVVRVLQEKLKWLNENEMKFKSNITRTSNQIQISTSTGKPTIMSKPSKWDIVRKFVLHGKKLNPVQQIFINNQTVSKTGVIPTKNSIAVERHKNTQNHYNNLLQSNLKTESEGGIKNIMDRFYESNNIDDILHSSENIENIMDAANDEDVLEVYNIDIPLNLDKNNDRELNTNLSLGKAFKNIDQNNLPGKNGHVRSAESVKPTLFQNTSTKPLNKMLEITTEQVKDATKKTHVWKQIYLWPINSTLSQKLSKELKNIFSRNKQQKSEHADKGMPLDEHFILTLNSENFTGKINDYLPESCQSDKSSPDYSFGYTSSIESASSVSEELYNNSYIFLIPKTNNTEKQTGWKRLLSFFHATKLVPYPKDKNSNVDFSNSSHLSENITTSNIEENVIAPEFNEERNVIRLPEYLMPEALAEKQLNDTDILFLEESNDVNDNVFEERTSSNGTFLFFFK